MAGNDVAAGAARRQAGVEHAAFVGAVTTFTLELFEQLDDGLGNLTVSPASLVTALAMLAPGATGSTADEITGLFGQGATAGWLAAEAGALEQRLTAPIDLGDDHRRGGAPGPGCTLHFANDLWVQQGLSLREAYLTLIDAAFRAGINKVDYVTEPERARREINDAIARHTGGEIRDLVPPGQISYLTRLILTNAVHLQASWAAPFEPAQTRPAPFHLLDGSTRTVPMLRRQDPLPYARVPGWQALRLDYVGHRLAMLLLLPDPPAAPRPERTLSAELLDGIRRALRQRDAELWLPKLRMDATLDLNHPLVRLGMRRAFSDEADFSAMVEPLSEPLKVDKVIQKTMMSVDEHGTVAAAATAVVMRTVAFRQPVDPVELRFDRPFLVLIEDTGTGYPLFMARVTEPPA
jgi:serpin B